MSVRVATAGLVEFGVDPKLFARDVQRRYSSELTGILDARTRARGAR